MYNCKWFTHVDGFDTIVHERPLHENPNRDD